MLATNTKKFEIDICRNHKQKGDQAGKQEKGIAAKQTERQEVPAGKGKEKAKGEMKRRYEEILQEQGLASITKETKVFCVRPMIHWGCGRMRLSGVPKIPAKVRRNSKLAEICLKYREGVRTAEDGIAEMKKIVDGAEGRCFENEEKMENVKEMVLYAKFSAMACYHEAQALEMQLLSQEKMWKEKKGKEDHWDAANK